MIEKIVLNYLNNELSVPVYMEMPKHAPQKFVVIEKTGSSKNDCIYTAMITLKSHAPTLYQAATLNDAVKAAMDNIIVLDEISKSQLNSDYNYTNTATKTYRYQAVYDIWHY